MSDSAPSTDYGDRGRVCVYDDAGTLAEAAAEELIAAIEAAVSARGRADVGLSGGSTPQAMARLLATSRFRDRVNWPATEIYWGDERWVPLDSPESNAGEAKRLLLDTAPIPPEQVHSYDTVSVSPEVSAARYEELIRQRVGLEGVLPAFDLIFLGLGEDGHTASLFPGTPAVHEQKRLVVGQAVPKLDTIRLTFTPPLINNARRVVFLVSGESKAERLAEVLDGPEHPEELPAQLVRPAGGPLWLVDRAAASRLARHPR
jgi:6-phosphogluconolactonase